jgi:thioredoxin-like negative regulator of GroEL
MAGGDDDAVTADSRGWRWDVVLSFAGAQRSYVEQVAEALKAQGVRCFYDADEQIELWGEHLPEELLAIYGEQAGAVVVFISAEYADRDWTRLERRAALDRAARERRAYLLPARFDDTPLPGLPRGIVTLDLRIRTPQQFAAEIAAKLTELGITGPGAALGNLPAAKPPGAVRVAEAALRRLGVHAAISVPGAPDEIPPEYVARDTDADEHGVRATVTAAAERGGFVLLTGGSSVGKTRCAAEAVRDLLPDWWLIHPDGPAEVAALAAMPPTQTVVWLDELQRYLDGEHGLSGGTIRALLNAPGPVVLIGTLWPDRYNAYITAAAPGGPDPHVRERGVLDLADVVRIAPEFSAAEQGRARAAATRDLRLAAAVKADEYGLTQILAAAPQLVARWENARETDPYAWAVLTAALDAARLGARAPITTDFLRSAAPGYCTSTQQAEAPHDWFEQALGYATTKLQGAAAALAPHGTGMGQTAGYTVADYLLQHAARERRATGVPASTWDAILTHFREPADAARLADSAASRLLYRYAVPLYRHAAAGAGYAAYRLAALLADRGDLDELRSRADAGDYQAAYRLADRLADRGDLDGLRGRADADGRHAAYRLAGLLAGRGDLDGLRSRAGAGDQYAAYRLADLLVDRGDLGEALQILRPFADAGDGPATDRLAVLLASRDDVDELRSRAEGGSHVTGQLADLFASQGDLDKLWALADGGSQIAAYQLAGLLADQGDLDEALQILPGLDGVEAMLAANRLTELLASRGDLDGLRSLVRALTGTPKQYDAARRLADLLADRGDIGEALQILRPLADAGGRLAADRLAGLLADHGDLDELRGRADAGNQAAAYQLAGLLADRGDIGEALQILRPLADAGSEDAAHRLADLLASRGDLGELRALAEGGNQAAAYRLADLLADRGDLDELRGRAGGGDQHAAYRLAGILSGRGRLSEVLPVICALVLAGCADTAQLFELLSQQGREEEADRLRRFGLNPDGSIADK